MECPLHHRADSEELTTLHGDFTLELVASSPVRALAFFAAVRDLAFLFTVFPAFDAARATMRSRLGTIGALTSARFVVLHR
jgi:hypothetical protein